jgi:hypothetical protein
LRGSWHHDWVFSFLSKIQHKHRMQIFSQLYAWNFEQISIYLSKPTISSWWNQWGVMAASPCNWWWRWWVWYSVSDTQGYDLQSCLLCWFFLLGWKLSPWIPFKLLLWNSLCILIDMIVGTSWTLLSVKVWWCEFFMTALSTHSAEWGEYYVSRPSQQVDSSPFISFFSRLHIYLSLNVLHKIGWPEGFQRRQLWVPPEKVVQNVGSAWIISLMLWPARGHPRCQPYNPVLVNENE